MQLNNLHPFLPQQLLLPFLSVKYDRLEVDGMGYGGEIRQASELVDPHSTSTLFHGVPTLSMEELVLCLDR